MEERTLPLWVTMAQPKVGISLGCPAAEPLWKLENPHFLYKQMKVLKPCTRWWVCSTSHYFHFCVLYCSSAYIIWLTLCVWAHTGQHAYWRGTQRPPCRNSFLHLPYGSLWLNFSHQTWCRVSVRTTPSHQPRAALSQDLRGFFVECELCLRIYLRSRKRTSESTKLCWKG